jgi:hypothetical protein
MDVRYGFPPPPSARPTLRPGGTRNPRESKRKRRRKTEGRIRRVGPLASGAQFPSGPAPSASVVLSLTHVPFPSCTKLLTRTNSHARLARRKQVSAEIVSLPCAHAATPSASQHVSKHLTGRHGSGGIPAASGRGPSVRPASEATCDNAAPLPSRRARSSTGWPTLVRRKPRPLVQQAVIPLASSGKRARFRTYTLRRGRR